MLNNVPRVQLDLPQEAVFRGNHEVIPRNSKFYGVILQKYSKKTDKITGQDWSNSEYNCLFFLSQICLSSLFVVKN